MPGAIFGFAFLAVLSTIGLAAASILASTMWPAAVARSDVHLRVHPLRCALSGLLLILAEFWLLVVLVPFRPFVLVLAVAADVVLLARGLPALAALVGERLGIALPPRAVAVGSILIALCGALPVVGWLMAAMLILQALGSAVLPTPRPPLARVIPPAPLATAAP